MIHKTINYLMIAFAFAFPISIGAANGLLALMVLLWLVEGDFKAKFQILFNEKIIWFLFIIPILLIISILFSDTVANGFLSRENESIYRMVLSRFIWLPMLLVIYITSIEKKYLKHIISSFLIAIFFSEIISYMIYFEIIDTAYFQKLNLLYKNASHINPTPFMQHIWYSFFLSVSILFIIDKLSNTLNIYLKLFLIFFLFSATVNLFINGGRTGQAAAILGLFVYVTTKYRFRVQYFLYATVAVYIVLTLAYNFSPNFNKRFHEAITDIKSASQYNFKSSWGARIASNINTWQYLTSSPKHFILGAGAGDSKYEYMHFAKTKMTPNIYEAVQDFPHLHNQYLQFWLDGSIFALFSFLLFFYSLGRLPLAKPHRALLYGSLTIIMFVQLSSNLAFRAKTYMLILFIASYFIVLSRQNRDKQTS